MARMDPVRRAPRLIVFTRFPELGRTKTRLIPALGAQGAADLHGRMAHHTLALVAELAARQPVRVEVLVGESNATPSGRSDAQLRCFATPLAACVARSAATTGSATAIAATLGAAETCLAIHGGVARTRGVVELVGRTTPVDGRAPLPWARAAVDRRITSRGATEDRHDLFRCQGVGR